MFSNIKDLCDPHNTQRFTCAGSKVVYNASIIWGTIGPQRMFQQGQVYSSLMYFFILGVSCPFMSSSNGSTDRLHQPVVTVLVYLAYRRFPHTWIRFINVPIFFNAAGNIPPANTSKPSPPRCQLLHAR
jgi:hypothetical protein